MFNATNDMTNRTKTPLAGYTLAGLQQVAAQAGLPRFTATQLAQWIYGRRATGFEVMNNISKAGRQHLAEMYSTGLYPPSGGQQSADGTVKYLFPTAGGQAVESVYIPEADRATLCISSQKGCKMNCSFCMTGRQGFHGNLTANEIINQVLSIPESATLTNVVFMGMGEPMDNIGPVLDAIEIMTAPWGLAWSPKRITVSSIGKMPELSRLIEQTSVHIAISVHSPFHDERASLMPVEKAFGVSDVMKTLRGYDFAHQRRLSVEYIMWEGINDDLRHAKALAKLIAGTNARVNLIRFHAIPGSPLRSSSEQNMAAFRDFLNSHGTTCTIRRSRGEDIFAACGMLAGDVRKAPQGA